MKKVCGAALTVLAVAGSVGAASVVSVHPADIAVELAGFGVPLPADPPPAATGVIPVGGGVGILVGDTWCTLTTIGHDRTGELIGLTSATCGGPGSPVSVADADGVRGSVVAADGGLDYAVIKFDPTEVSAISDFAGFPINGIGPEAETGQRACKDSRRNGVVCAEVSKPGPDPDTMLLHKCGNAEDSGAPVTVNALLVGMMRGGYTKGTLGCPIHYGLGNPSNPVGADEVPMRDRPEITSINAILGDINAKGGPGAGFIPAGA